MDARIMYTFLPNTLLKKAKVFPLHAMEVLGGRGGIAPIHS
jgi:hypothetical protein